MRRHAIWFWVALGLAAAVALSVVTARSAGAYPDPLDPQNPAPRGAQAVARVLAAQGVDVTVVRSPSELAAAGVDAATTVLLTSAFNLGLTNARRFESDTAGAGLVVVVEPTPATTQALRLPDQVDASQHAVVRPAACSDPTVAGLQIDVEQQAAYGSDGGCFPADRGYLLAPARPGWTTLGAPDVLTNERVLRADNAAVALRLLGQRPRLVWYVASAVALPAGEGQTFSSLLPSWFAPSVWLAALTVLSVMLWRGRRLGPLATEPIPVTVKAIETTRSRGRLYRRAGDRPHAAAVLRRATARRLADHLALGQRVSVARIAEATAAHLGTEVAGVRQLLDGPPPTSDPALVALAHDLSTLEAEVRRR